MKVLVLNGMQDIDSKDSLILNRLTDKLDNMFELEVINLKEKKIASCQGCFGCWVKTPGVCVINDDGREITQKFMINDCVILLTPVMFGGFSSTLKKAIDRLIPNILPFFTKKEGETHHIPRYKKYPALISIGLLKETDNKAEDIFHKLIKRMSINMHSPAQDSFIIYKNSEDKVLTKRVDGISKKVGVING